MFIPALFVIEKTEITEITIIRVCYMNYNAFL